MSPTKYHASPRAVEKAFDMAGQYLDKLGKTDLMSFTPYEFRELVVWIADAAIDEDHIPF